MTTLSDALSTATRGMIIPPPGHRFLVGDFAQMEARCMAWGCGNRARLKDFASGVDPYKKIAAIVYDKLVSEVTKDERFVGKVNELMYQYQGGIGGGYKMSKSYGISFRPLYEKTIQAATTEQIDSAEFCTFLYLKKHKESGSLEKPCDRETAYTINILKDRWRAANPEVVQYWKDLENAAILAVQSGKPCEAGSAQGRVTFFTHKQFLFCKLPSGRRIAWLYPKVSEGDRGKLTLLFLGDKGWETTYGGKLAENIVQAIQRDLLRDSMIRLENKYPVCMHVHDELVSAVPIGFGSIEEFLEIMQVLEPWAFGIPMQAEGFECMRYRK